MAMKRMLLILVPTVFILGVCPAAFAEEEDGRVWCSGNISDEECVKQSAELRKRRAGDIQPSFLVPDSPALAVLGMTGDNVIRPNSARELGLSLLNGSDPRGNAQTGFALDTAPYQFTGVTLGQYRDSYWQRLLTNTEISIGTTKGGSDDDKSVRASIGLRINLFDMGDAKRDFSLDQIFKDLDPFSKEDRAKLGELVRSRQDKEFQIQAQKNQLNATTDPDSRHEIEKKIVELEAQEAAIEAQREELVLKASEPAEKKWTKAIEEFEKGTWNASSMDIGYAPTFFSEDGSYGDFNQDGYAVYGTLAYGFDDFRRRDRTKADTRGWLAKYAQVLVHARYTENEHEAQSEGQGFSELNTTIFGGQFRVQGPKIWADEGGDFLFSLEVSSVSKDYSNRDSEDVMRYVGAVELKPFKNSGFTIKGAIGSESGGSDSDGGFIVTTLNWATQ